MKRSWETIERNHSQLKEEFGNLVNAMDMVGFTMEVRSLLCNRFLCSIHTSPTLTTENLQCLRAAVPW